jgi:hypothetical protein
MPYILQVYLFMYRNSKFQLTLEASLRISREKGNEAAFGDRGVRPLQKTCCVLITMRIQLNLAFEDPIDIGKVKEGEGRTRQRDTYHNP